MFAPLERVRIALCVALASLRAGPVGLARRRVHAVSDAHLASPPAAVVAVFQGQVHFQTRQSGVQI